MATKDETPKAGHNGMSKDEFSKFVAELNELDKKKKAAQADYRNACKRFKEAGGDNDMLKVAMKVYEQDPVSRRDDHNTLVKYLSFLDVPVNTQFALFPDNDTEEEAA